VLLRRRHETTLLCAVAPGLTPRPRRFFGVTATFYSFVFFYTVFPMQLQAATYGVSLELTPFRNTR
jgi:hypothetical protein